MQQYSSVFTVERGVPSVCPPGCTRGARGSRPRAETRCWVWCRDTTAREAVIRSCSEVSRSAGTWRQTLELSMNLREVFKVLSLLRHYAKH